VNFRMIFAGLLALAAFVLRLDNVQRLPIDSALATQPAPKADGAGDAALLQPARLLSAVFGAAAVFVLALASPAAGALLALHSLHVRYTATAMLEALPFLSALICALAHARAGFRWNRWTAASAVALGVTAASKYLYCVVGLAILLDYAAALLRRRKSARDERAWPPPQWQALVAWGTLAVFVFLLLDPYLWPDPVGRLLSSLQFHTANAGAAVNNTRYVGWQPLLWLTSSATVRTSALPAMIEPLTLAAAIFGAPALWRRSRLHALWILLGTIFLFLYANKWPQYALSVLAPLCLSAAGFIDESFRGIRATARAALPVRRFAVLGLCALVFGAGAWIGGNWHQGDPAFRSAVQEAARRMRDDEALLFAPANPYIEPAVGTPLTVLGDGDGLPIVAWDWSPARRLAASQTTFDFHTANHWLSEAAQGRMGVWLITYRPLMGDPADALRALMQRQAHALAVTQQREFERTYALTHFRFDEPFAAITGTQAFRDARIEEAYGRDVGLRSDGCAQLSAASAGGFLEIACLWRILPNSGAPWNTQASLRLYDSGGAQVLQSDQLIARSGLPTVRFDGVLFGGYFIPLPETLPAGDYQLRLFPYGADGEYAPRVSVDVKLKDK